MIKACCIGLDKCTSAENSHPCPFELQSIVEVVGGAAVTWVFAICHPFEKLVKLGVLASPVLAYDIEGIS